MMRHGALFNGIGGFQLAAHWMGWDNVMHCEIDEFCNKVVKKHFPNSIQHGDIKTTDFKKYRGTIDIITGGFPCQPYSTAGKRKGSEDDRHLWPEMLRAIREISPRWVVGENVRGLTNWNGGLVFDQVQADLEAEGYEVLPFLLPACGVNAPHRRDRIWIIAHAKISYRHLPAGPKEWKEKMDIVGDGTTGVAANTHGNDNGWEDGPHKNRCEEGKNKSEGDQRQWIRDGLNRDDEKGAITDTTKFTEREQAKETNALTESRQTWIEPGSNSGGWDGFPTQSPVCGGDDGIPLELHIIERVEYEYKISNQKSKPEIGYVIWEALRKLWQYREIAKASPELYFKQVCDSLSIMPYKGRSIGWLQEGEKAKELCGMWESFYTLPFQEAQYLQQKLLINYRQEERRKKMEQGQRMDRLKSLGNAIVPQVAYQIFKAIEMYEND